MKSKTPLPPILLVDDNADEAFLVERLVRKSGVPNPVRHIRSGQEAIEVLRASCRAAGGRPGDKPVLVFLDLKMPLCHGFEVLRWIRRKRALRHVRVVILSNSDEPSDVAAALAGGADGYLMKYPSPAMLAAVFQQALPAGATTPR